MGRQRGIRCFASHDQSRDVSLDRGGAAAIPEELSARISNSSHFLCIVVKESYVTAWAAWKTQKAATLKKKLVFVNTNSVNNAPPALQRSGAS
jgi:hypothetical protein